jgi:predicted site-specific integrase-resolvase
MATAIRGTTYFQTAEACRIAGISKNTFFRWLRAGKLQDVATADRHGWRLFSAADVERLCRKSHRISTMELAPVS